MDINLLGLASASATFLGVWIGHVSVRKIEREVDHIWIPAMLALFLGIGLLTASLSDLEPDSVHDLRNPRCDLALGRARTGYPPA